MKNMQDLVPGDIARGYVGKIHKCCCSCSGKYYEDNATITKVLRTIQANEDSPSLDFGLGYIAVEVGKKVFIAYLV